MVPPRRVIAATALVALMVVVASAAVAKGPHTASLGGPGIEEPIVFIDWGKDFGTYSNQAPMDLIGVLGFTGPGRTRVDPPANPGPQYTVAWSITGAPGDLVGRHTIYTHLYPDATGGPMTHTPEQISVEESAPALVGWFRAPDNLKETIQGVIDWAITPDGQSMQPESRKGPQTAVQPKEQPLAVAPPPGPQAAEPSPVLLTLAAATAVGLLLALRLRLS